MEQWHQKLYECLGILFSGTAVVDQNQANINLIELIGDVQPNTMVDVYLDILTKAHVDGFISSPMSSHILFWAASGLRGLVQSPQAWGEFGSDRQGNVLTTLLKLLSIASELDNVVIRQVADTVSCATILMAPNWPNLFSDLFQACQVTSVDSLAESGGHCRVEVLLSIFGGIATHVPRLSPLLSVPHHLAVMNIFHQSAFQQYLHPFILQILISALTTTSSTIATTPNDHLCVEDEKLVGSCLECLQCWAACDMGENSSNKLHECSSWVPLVFLTTPIPTSTSTILSILLSLITEPRGSSSLFAKAVGVLDQVLMFPCRDILELVDISTILHVFVQLLQHPEITETHEFYLTSMSRFIFTLLESQGEVLFSSSFVSPILEACLLSLTYRQNMEYVAVPSLECWCNIIYLCPHLFDSILITRLVSSIMNLALLPHEFSEDMWLNLCFRGETVSEDYLEALQCFRTDAADTLIAIFDMKSVRVSHEDENRVDVGTIILKTLMEASTSAFTRANAREVEVVIWAGCQFVETVVYIEEEAQEEEYGEDDGHYGPASDSHYGPSIGTPIKGAPSFTSASQSPVFRPQQSDEISKNEWNIWYHQLVMALSSMPLSSTPILACCTCRLFKELALLMKVIGKPEVLIHMLTTMVDCMTLPMATLSCAGSLFSIIYHCSHVIAGKHLGEDSDSQSAASPSFGPLTTLLEQAHRTTIPTCLASTSSSEFKQVLKSLCALTLLTYVDCTNENSNRMETAANQIMRLLSPRLKWSLEVLSQSSVNQYPSNGIQQVEAGLNVITKKSLSESTWTSFQYAELANLLMSMLWPDLMALLQLSNVAPSEGTSSDSEVCLVEGAVYGCMTELFQSISDLASTNCAISDHIRTVIVKALHGNRYLLPNLVRLIRCYYDHYVTNVIINHNHEDSNCIIEILSALLERCCMFQNRQNRTDVWLDIEFANQTIQTIGVDSVIVLIELNREVLKNSINLVISNENTVLLKSFWYVAIAAIYASCINHESHVSYYSGLMRVAATLLKEIIQLDCNQFNLAIYLNHDEEPVAFLFNTVFLALGHPNKRHVHANNVNTTFIRYISDILYTMLYDVNTQPFILSTARTLLQREMNSSGEELLALVGNGQWGMENRGMKQKFVRFISQASVVWSGKALPQSAIDLAN